MEDLIDFPCSGDFLDFYHERGLTLRTSGRVSREYKTLLEELKKLRQENQAIWTEIVRLRKENNALLTQLESIVNKRVRVKSNTKQDALNWLEE